MKPSKETKWTKPSEGLPKHGETVRTIDDKGRIYRTQAFYGELGIRFKIVGYVWEHSHVVGWTYEDGEVSGYEN